jgi:nicotinamidase-related amidase
MSNADRTPLKAPQDSTAECVLLILDMISTWRFDQGEPLVGHAARIVPAIASLRRRCTTAGMPVIYVNDNFGHWRSDFRDVLTAARTTGGAAEMIADALSPRPEDYFVLKPKHSAFHATPLRLLLNHLRAHAVILTGVASDSCVTATAFEAHMLDIDVIVPADASASSTPAKHRAALAHLRDSLQISTPKVAHIRPASLLRRRPPNET